MERDNKKKYAEELMNTFYSLRHQIISESGCVLKGYNLTLSQWLVLGTIHGHRCETVKDIAELLGISSSAATQLVHGLEKEEYVKRVSEEKDRRYTRIIPSKKSKEILKEIQKKSAKKILETFGVLSEKEFKTYLFLNKKIVEYIQTIKKRKKSLCHF
jgi:DNA-binding MarR family transcriptional regulator